MKNLIDIIFYRNLVTGVLYVELPQKEKIKEYEKILFKNCPIVLDNEKTEYFENTSFGILTDLRLIL